MIYQDSLCFFAVKPSISFDSQHQIIGSRVSVTKPYTAEYGYAPHPETEAKLNELAQRTHRGTDELLEEAVDHLVAYNEWFEHKVKNSMRAAERGETIPDQEVRAWIEQRERS
jgi:predicted transcriptional regulator